MLLSADKGTKFKKIDNFAKVIYESKINIHVPTSLWNPYWFFIVLQNLIIALYTTLFLGGTWFVYPPVCIHISLSYQSIQ